MGNDCAIHAGGIQCFENGTRGRVTHRLGGKEEVKLVNDWPCELLAASFNDGVGLESDVSDSGDGDDGNGDEDDVADGNS